MEGGLSKLASSVANSVELLPLVYKDLAQPSVQKVGKALEAVVGLGNTALLPVMLLNQKTQYWFEKHMNDYKAKLEAIPEEKICEVPPEVGVPILEKLTYTTNEDIADLFTTLLSKASSTDTTNQAHPKFVSIISSLSADEAKIVKYIYSDVLYVDLRLYQKDVQGFHTVMTYMTGLEYKLGLTFPANMSVYIQNLITLGILTDMGDVYKVSEEGYKKLYTTYSVREEEVRSSFIALNPQNAFDRTEWRRSYLKLNPFGQLFIQACKAQTSVPTLTVRYTK